MFLLSGTKVQLKAAHYHIFLPKTPLWISSTAAGLYVEKAKQVVVFFNSLASD